MAGRCWPVIPFITTFFLDITGVPLHQWIGVAVGVIVVYHLISHWAWVKSVTLHFFGKTSNRLRIYYLLDASLLMGLLAIISTGLVISTWLNLSLVAYTAWHFIHVAASLITLLAIVLKVGLHWRWIASVAKNIFTRPSLEPRGATGMVSTSTGKLVGRREFNRVMAVVGVSTIAAAIQGADEEFRKANLSALERRSQFTNDSIDYFPPLASQASSIGRSWDGAELSPTRGCRGQLSSSRSRTEQVQPVPGLEREVGEESHPRAAQDHDEGRGEAPEQRSFKSIQNQVEEAFAPPRK